MPYAPKFSAKLLISLGLKGVGDKLGLDPVGHGGSKSRHTPAVSAEREAPWAGQYKATSLQLLLIIKSITLRAPRGPGLTPRSTGAPTAGHLGTAGGTRYIFTGRAKASCRCRPVTSNVRHRKISLVVLQQSLRLRREQYSHEAAKPQERAKHEFRQGFRHLGRN